MSWQTFSMHSVASANFTPSASTHGRDETWSNKVCRRFGIDLNKPSDRVIDPIDWLQTSERASTDERGSQKIWSRWLQICLLSARKEFHSKGNILLGWSRAKFAGNSFRRNFAEIVSLLTKHEFWINSFWWTFAAREKQLLIFSVVAGALALLLWCHVLSVDFTFLFRVQSLKSPIFGWLNISVSSVQELCVSLTGVLVRMFPSENDTFNSAVANGQLLTRDPLGSNPSSQEQRGETF